MPASMPPALAPSRSAIPAYRTIKGILAAGTEHGDDRSRRPAPRRRRAMLRGPDAFDTADTDGSPESPIIHHHNHIELRRHIMTIHDPSLRAR